MNRGKLFDLTRDVREHFEWERIVIAGSQAIHAVATDDSLPGSALRSIEVDIVFELLRETAFGGAVNDRKLSLRTKLEEAGLDEAASCFK